MAKNNDNKQSLKNTKQNAGENTHTYNADNNNMKNNNTQNNNNTKQQTNIKDYK